MIIHEVSDTAQPYLRLWAKSKPYKQLLAHMVDSGCCAMEFLSAASSRAILEFLEQQWNCNKETALSYCSYFTAMHDIGKAMPQFQCMDEIQYARLTRSGLSELFSGILLQPIRHEFYSASIAKRIWRTWQSANRRLYQPYSCVLSLHHQRIDQDNGRKIIPEVWQNLQNHLEEFIRSAFNAEANLPTAQNMDAVCTLLTGLIILCDWVASSGPFEGYPETNEDYLHRSLEIANETLNAYGLIGDEASHSIESFQTMWPVIMSPRDIQTKCEQLDYRSLLTIIEAPMGEGKTEAALYLAERMRQNYNKRGIYVALPTQATSNQMFERTAAMLRTIEGGKARLMHGSAFLYEDEKHFQSDDAAEAERWLSSLRMAFLDENGVGTVDQAMAGVLIARFSVLRLLGLTNKVLVIDEVHAYDAYMKEIIKSLLSWCKALSIPVILLSATLQESQRREYLSCYIDENDLPELSDAYPLIMQINGAGDLIQLPANATLRSEYTFESLCIGEDVEEIARFAVKKVKNGGCYCILVNTVKKAQSVYHALLETKTEDIETILFHARFTMARRHEIEADCLRKFGNGKNAERPARAILVATQVVEQSLDLDFDGMVSEIAPIDLLLQRAGRVHRHRFRQRPSGMEKPVIDVILPDKNAHVDPEKRYAGNGYVYEPFLLNNTEHLVENGLTVCVPDDVRTVIAKVYETVTDENFKTWCKRGFSQQLQQANGGGVAFPLPTEETFFASQSQTEFENIEIDDGFEPVTHVSTRLGDPTLRIAFANTDLLEAAKTNHLTKLHQKQIFLSSVAISMRGIQQSDLENDSLFRIDRGVLRGCYITDQPNEIRIGNRTLVNDPMLGIHWKE